MRKIVIVGGGAFGRELLSWAQSARGPEAIIGYADDAGSLMDEYEGIALPFLGAIDEVDVQDVDLALAISDPATKQRIAEQLAYRGARFATIIHPSAVVAATAMLAEGVVIGPHAYIANHSRLDRLVSVNSLCGIGHDARIGACCTISSQVDVMGGVELGHRVFVGSGARILPGIQVGEGARIGAGAVVVRRVKVGQALFAAPARTL